MTYTVELSPKAEQGLKQHQKVGNQKLLKKISALFSEMEEHPRSGTGKPEQLKGYEAETWSRRIDSRHRIIYEIEEARLKVYAISTYGHYQDR